MVVNIKEALPNPFNRAPAVLLVLVWGMNASSIDELVETILDEYEKYDGDTMERVWQSLFEVCDQTLRLMGDNDFKVEHTGVSRRRRAGTLERVVKYDQEALTKAWDYLASSPSDGEDDKRFFFFSVTF